MNPFVRYFISPDDETASRALTSSDALPLVMDGYGIEPTVALAVLEDLLGGRSLDDILDDEQSHATVAISDTAEMFVIRLGPSFEQFLLDIDRTQLEAVAPYWASSEEMEGARPTELLAFVTDLRDLVSRSQEAGAHVYCLMGL